MTAIVLTPSGPFSLAASTRFLEGFGPARYTGADDGVLRFAFPVETPGAEWPAVGLAVIQRADGAVVADLDDEVPDDVRARASTQLARILSLDVDGSGFAAIGAADPVVGALQARFAGLRPVCFYSPYEAACWAVLSHRVRIAQAAAVKARIASRHGERRTIAGVEMFAFPDPATLLATSELEGVPQPKVERLHALARAAAEGRLTGERLRALDPAEAMADLQRLPGIGPFSAELTLIRGAGAPDVFAQAERRLHATMVQLYRLPGSEPARLNEVARRWSPYRSWVSVLIRVYRESPDRPVELPAGVLAEL
ncbi:DNA-3-methyladenine glycosylase family protein [Cryptosporangium phraense]|uniref:DNA-3-methyladenine glycosylase II n=1 Tax=Cryptosporangium phraense TaxID=2593070 RepID=A0A545AQG4_9ACTN|nr:DNA-3-methyladenine glycosylase [Cryptosporangium phraense]TQS43566.1 DNA-3-methyladenine glycosylase 2 family protein [Cryptosporangium phraense]